MKKIIILLALLIPSVTLASIDTNLKYGQNSNEVSELQDFLVDKGFLKTNPTGFFGLLTFKAVKEYQTSVDVPSTGYVGILTRGKINTELESAIVSSAKAETEEVGTPIPLISPVLEVQKNITIKSQVMDFTGTVSELKEVATVTPSQTKRYTLEIKKGNAKTTIVEITGGDNWGDKETHTSKHIGGDNEFFFSAPNDVGNYTYKVSFYSDSVGSQGGQIVYPTQLLGETTGTFEIK